MKRTIKNIINILIIVLSIIGYLITIHHTININIDYIDIVGIYSYIMFISIITLIASTFHKHNFKEVLKNKTITIIISFMILSFAYTYFTPKLVTKFDNTDYETLNETLHGRYYMISEDQLKIINSVKSYNVNKKYQADAKEYKYKDIFDKKEIANVYINLDNNNWQYLLQNAQDKPSVLTDKVKINDYTLKYAGLKTKGFSTLYHIWKSPFNRFSYTINFGKYINKDNGFKEKQNLLGVRKISLNSMLWDPTMMKEYLSYYLCTEMGLPTPDYNLANLYVNNNYKGVYLMVEGIDKALIKRTLNDDSEFTFKVEPAGGELIYDNRLDRFINENGEFDFSPILYDKEGNLVYPDKTLLMMYNGIWENDKENFEEIVDLLPTFFKSLKELTELANTKNKNTKEYEERLSKIIDVDSLARYWAVNTFLSNTDGYQGEVAVNYAIHMNKDGYITIIPWDYNLAFGGKYFKNTEEIINFDINNPLLGTTMEKRPLLNIIINNKTYNELYKKYLKDVITIASLGGTTSDNKEYPKDNLKAMLEDKKDYIVKQQEKDLDSFFYPETIAIANDNLAKLIELRSQAINNQLNNDNTKVESDIDIKTVGFRRDFVNIKKD